MRDEQVSKRVLDEVVSGNRVEIPLGEFVLRWLPFILLDTVNIVTLIIMDFFPLHDYEFIRAGLSILACNPADDCCRQTLLLGHGIPAFLEEVHFF